MTFGTVIEIIVAVLSVFGLYCISKMLACILAYDKQIRSSVYIAVEMSENDSEETRELKKMCARQMSLDTLGHTRYVILKKDKD